MALYYQSSIRNLPEGYSFRGALLTDIPVVAYLFNQRQTTYPSRGSFLGAELRNEWQTHDFNPAMDVRLVFDQREHLIGYIEVWTSKNMASHPWLWGCVHSDYEGRGIGTAMLRWAEARVRLAMELLPAHLRVAPRFGTQHDLETASALCKNLGWKPIRGQDAITPAVRSLISARRLLDSLDLQTNNSYDVYEKEIRPGDDLIPVAA